ncbi:MAG: hypothetical protein KKF77_13560 [Proteobacteria bacterium]|nr:hypothetical protein [Pseudomonadota bacterium]
MKRFFTTLPALIGLLALALLLPAAGLASDMFPKPPVPSSRDMGRTKMTSTKTGQPQSTAAESQSNIKLGKVVKSGETTKTTTTNPPASLQ